MDMNDLPESLSAVVLNFCQEKLPGAGFLSVHGNITVIADTTTTVAFFSRKLQDASGKCTVSTSNSEMFFPSASSPGFRNWV